MAGTNTSFNAFTFRTAIKTAMQMGSPNATADKVTFKWDPVKTYSRQDENHKPYDWSSTPATSTQHADVLIDVAIEVLGNPTAEYTSIGNLNAQKVSLTILDTDFAQITGATGFTWGQKKFNIDYIAPPVALFSVDVHTIFASAVDL